MELSPLRNTERGGKIITKENCSFVISDTKSLMGDREKGTKIELKDKDEFAGEVTIDHLGENEIGKTYVQLRSISVKSPYLGGNASQLLYEKSIEFAESLNKKLLFDSSLTIGAYKSFKKLENLGYEIIENPVAKFDGVKYTAPGSWVLRVERKQVSEEEIENLDYVKTEELMSRMKMDGTWRIKGEDGQNDWSPLYAKLMKHRAELENPNMKDANNKLDNEVNI